MKTNELLRRYVDDRSEPAFEELVEQHIDLVFSSALRRVNGDVATAQDVTQAVFTELARNAPKLTQHTSLAGWLYTSTRYLATKTLRTEQRRRCHEQEAHEMNKLLHSTDLDTTWQELRPMLDDAMHDLSSTDREAILMRYFERLPLAEIGARLSLKENAAHMRIERAIDRLRAALSKRGVTSTITALAVLLTGRAVGSAPPGLSAQVSRAALATAAATGGLTWGLLKLVSLMKGHALAVAGAAALVAAFIVVPKLATTETTSTVTASTASTQEKATALMPSVAAGAGAVVDSAPVAAAVSTTNQMTIRIIADDTGKSVAGATIEFFVGEKAQRGMIVLSPLTRLTATDQGVCEIPVSRGSAGVLLIRSRNDGFVDTDYTWNPNRGERVPQQYTLRLVRAVPIGGQVVNEEGQPVAGAEVSVQNSETSDSETSPNPPHISTDAGEQTVTDINGRWRIDRFSKEAIPMISFQATHPDYAVDGWIISMGDSEVERQRLAGTYIYKLDLGMTVAGIIVDSDGQPVAGAKVSVQSGTRSRETTNQSDGTFTLTGCKAGVGQINAEAHGFALATFNVALTNNQTPLRLELRRGYLLRLRVVDTNGLPVPNAIARPNFNPTVVGTDVVRVIRPDLFQRQTGPDGLINWDSAPSSELLFSIQADGYIWANNVSVKADGEEHLITLQAARAISGSVQDAATSQPVSRFRIITGNLGFPGATGLTNVHWGEGQTFRDGKFRCVDDSPAVGLMFKFEADGYVPFVTRAIGPDEGDVSFDITLQPAVAATITVVLPDGRPATNASIGFEMPGTYLNWVPGGFERTPMGGYTNVFSTDDSGRFVLPPDDTITRVIAACSDGYAEAAPATLADKATMRLQPWGRIDGTFLSDGKPAAGRVLTVGTSSQEGPTVRVLNVYHLNVETDVEGHFSIPKVPPGQLILFQEEMQGAFRGFTPLQNPAVTVRPGETTTVSLDLHSVTARLRWPVDVSRDTNWRVSGWISRAEVLGQPTSEGSLRETDDGTWQAEDLPAGNHTIQFIVLPPAPRGIPVKPLWRAEMPLIIPDGLFGGPVDAGEIVLRPAQ
jgi:RNA polymerase sigma factor (sigma-70 family)